MRDFSYLKPGDKVIRCSNRRNKSIYSRFNHSDIDTVKEVSSGGLINIDDMIFEKDGTASRKHNCVVLDSWFLLDYTQENIDILNTVQEAFDLMDNTKEITQEQAKNIIEILKIK